MKRINKIDKKIDLTGLALFTISKEAYKKCEIYEKELEQHLLKKGYLQGDIDMCLWQSIFEPNETYEETVIKYLEGKKNDNHRKSKAKSE